MLKVKIKRRKKEEEKVEDLTDEEEEGECETTKKLRRTKRTEFEEELSERLAGPGKISRWKPNQEDEHDMEVEFKAHIILNGKKITSQRHAVPEEVLEKIKTGKPLEPNEKQYTASSASSYEQGLKKLLFVWQESLREKCPQLLSDDQRLHLRQFWSFRSPQFIKPTNIIPLLDDSPSFEGKPSMKRLALEAYFQLLDVVIRKLDSHETYDLFLQPVNDDEESWDNEKRRRKADKKINELMTEIRNKKDAMRAGNPHGRWEGEREGLNRLRKANETYFVGIKTPNPTEILPIWLNHPETKAFDQKLFDYADAGSAMSGPEIVQMSNYLATRLFCKQGMRTEIGKNLKWGDYLEAKQKGFAAFPHKQVHWDTSIDIDPSIKHRLNDENVYVREDPYKPDPYDPTDDMKNPVWDCIKGYCIVIHLHKTGYKFPCYVWFSLVDDARMVCWEKVCNDYMESIGKKKTVATPMFINSAGESLLGSHHTLDLKDFARIVKIPKATVYTFREMFTNFVYDSKSGKLANIISIFF